jgi:hypothetical protein
MIKNRIMAFFLIFCIFTLMGRGTQNAATESCDIASIKTISALDRNTTIQGAVLEIFSEVNLTLGIASLNKCSDVEHVFKVPKGISLSEALDQLMRIDQAHRWTKVGKTVRIMPLSGIPELLQTTISSMHITDETNLHLSIDELLGTPEVRLAASKLQLWQRMGEVGYQPLRPPNTPRQEEKPLDIQNISLIDAIELLVNKHPGGTIWLYRENRCDQKSVSFLDIIKR